jgi:pimeloyl-ACP methyl ester carboxylesterase
MTSIMFPIQGQLLAANFTHKLLQKAKAHPRSPILIHLFSGGGFIFMGWVFQLLAELNSQEAEAVRSRIAGVILDSSPAMVTADVSSRALIAAAMGRPAEGIEQEFPWLVKPAAAIVDGYLRLPYVKDVLVGMDKAWMQQAPPCPKLFLYSDADVLVQPQVVEGFMQQQQKRGSATYSFKWSDSAHVDHYRKYPEEYKQQLQQFAQQVLSGWASKAAAEPQQDA